MRIAPKILFPILFCVTTTFIGCGQWVDDESWGESVWADDAERVAVTRQYYQRKDTPGGYVTRNFSFEIYTASVNGLGEPVLRGVRTTGAPEGLYYMSGSDYVLVTSRVPSEQGPMFTAYQFLTNGEMRTIQTVGTDQSRQDCGAFQAVNNTANPVRAIPSPDGSVLGVAYIGLSCDGITVNIQFFDSVTAQPLRAASEYPLPANTTLTGEMGVERSFVSYMRVAWSTDGRFMISFNEVNQQGAAEDSSGWYLATDGTSEAFARLDASCFEPVTTSSTINAAGQDIVASRNEGLRIEASHSDTSFGCAD